MTTTKLTVVLDKAGAARLFATLEHSFEEDGLPLALREVEEDGPLHEVAVYAEEPGLAAARLGEALAGLGLDAAIGREPLPDIDWVARSLEGLMPVRAGRFLVYGAHDRDRRRANDIAVEIEAGQAFGTGHHGTTAGCLEMLTTVARREGPRRLLDLGTGSGVLAIALAKLLRRPVLATDIDPVAVQVAAANARLNQADHLVRVRVAAGFASSAVRAAAPFDLVVANILARPLMALAPRFAAHLAPGGSLVLSGILDRQRRAVIAAFVGQGFRHVRTLHREGWATIHVKR